MQPHMAVETFNLLICKVLVKSMSWEDVNIKCQNHCQMILFIAI